MIASRGSAPSALSDLRREKKNKRDAERGASKGRKIKYTVHEKAQNFVVPAPFADAWTDEQADELFSSLFGGVGMKGARSEEVDLALPVSGGLGNGLESLGGLRVF